MHKSKEGDVCHTMEGSMKGLHCHAGSDRPNFRCDIQSRPRAGSAGAAPSGTTKVVYEAKLPSSMRAASSSKLMGEVCVQDNCMTVRVRVSHNMPCRSSTRCARIRRVLRAVLLGPNVCALADCHCAALCCAGGPDVHGVA